MTLASSTGDMGNTGLVCAPGSGGRSREQGQQLTAPSRSPLQGLCWQISQGGPGLGHAKVLGRQGGALRAPLGHPPQHPVMCVDPQPVARPRQPPRVPHNRTSPAARRVPHAARRGREDAEELLNYGLELDAISGTLQGLGEQGQ